MGLKKLLLHKAYYGVQDFFIDKFLIDINIKLLFKWFIDKYD